MSNSPLKGRVVGSQTPTLGKWMRYGLPEGIATFFLVLLGVIVIAPLFIPFLFVFKTQLEYAYHPWALPTSFKFDNFLNAWQAIRIDQGLINTTIVCLGAIATTIPCAALAGYVFARYKSKITEVCFYAILIGYFVPSQMVLIPLYKMEVALHLNNTLYGLFLPMAAFGIPFWTMIYRSYFASLPAELAEAARIDGAGHAKSFFLIMLPLPPPCSP